METGQQPETPLTPRLKLTPSCSRCRTKKLKCRYSDGNTVCCIICEEKGLGDECHRDVRMSRGKRIKLSAGEVIDPTPNKQKHSSTSEASDRQAKMQALRRKLKELESLERDDTKPMTPESSEHYYPRSSSSMESQTWSTGDAAGRVAIKKPTKSESVALSLEDYVVHGKEKRGQSGSSSSTLPRDVAQNKWQKAATIDERLNLLRAAKQCQFASDEVVVRELVSVFLYRVNHLVGHVIYSPGYQRAAEAFMSMSVEECVMSKAFVDPCCLSTMMLVLCLGYDFHPHHPPPGRAASPGFLAVQKIRQGAIDPTVHWYAIARQSLAVEGSYHLPSIPALQAACLFLARGKENDGWMKMMHHVAVSSARTFGLHNLGQAKADPRVQVEDFIRLECGIRIWNYLTMRDWSLANDQDHLSLIHPDQMTTRKPLNIDDEDIERGLRESRSDTEWTNMSFVLAQIELAQLIRDSSTLQHRGILKERADDYLRRLPHYFRLDSHINSPGLLPVQRWLLHQQVFDLQLRLWRNDLTSAEGRLHCLDLAEKIIDHQAIIRAICPVIDNLQVNFFHLFGACMVVLLDLIYQNKKKARGWHDNRLTARSKIMHALELFQGNAKYGRGVRILRIMLSCEEEAYSGTQQASTAASSPEDSLSHVAERILSEVKMSSEQGQMQTERPKEIWPSFISYNRIPDHTLLPAVGAWSHPPSNSQFKGGNDMYTSATTLQRSSTSGSEPITPLTTDSVLGWALDTALDPFEAKSSAFAGHSNPSQHPTISSHSWERPSILRPVKPT
jgi:hypothetical protein